MHMKMYWDNYRLNNGQSDLYTDSLIFKESDRQMEAEINSCTYT